MKTQLAGVDRGKEVLTQSGDEQQTCQAKCKQTQGEQFAVIEAELEEPGIAVSKRFETALTGMMDAREDAMPVLCVGIPMTGGFFLHEVHHQRRHQRSREKIRGEQSKHDCFSQAFCSLKRLRYGRDSPLVTQPAARVGSRCGSTSKTRCGQNVSGCKHSIGRLLEGT